MRIGIFGGSFDPIHMGHLILAELCRESCDLDEVHFMPASVPPHKQDQGRAPADDRLAMLKLAIGGNAQLQTSTIELERGGVSYTVETLQSLHQQRPLDELFFLMGADSLFDLPNWRSPQEICDLATIVVVDRPGSKAIDFDFLRGIASDDQLERFRRSTVSIPQIDISSSEIRRRVRAGRSIRYQTTPAVERYISEAGLYRNT